MQVDFHLAIASDKKIYEAIGLGVYVRPLALFINAREAWEYIGRMEKKLPEGTHFNVMKFFVEMDNDPNP